MRNPSTVGSRQIAPGNAHGTTGGSDAHGIIYNQNKETCECFPHRVSADSEQDILDGKGK